MSLMTGIGVVVSLCIQNVTQDFKFPYLERMWLQQFRILTSKLAVDFVD
jgi:hypothetical protein